MAVDELCMFYEQLVQSENLGNDTEQIVGAEKSPGPGELCS